MRLIDADVLQNEVDSWGCNDYDKYDFLEAIDNAPTVERPQGDEWEDYSIDFYKCPECGYLLNKNCPQCMNKIILPNCGGER